jgi:hypothetical protein
MREPVKRSLLENLLQDSKIPEVERRKLQSASLKGLGERPLREWVKGKTLPQFPQASPSSSGWQDHH